MTSAENNISEPPNLKIFCGRIPHTSPTRLVHSALVIMPPLQKPSNGPVHRNEYRCKLSYKVAKFVTSDCTVCARSFYSSGNITYCPLVVSPYFSRQKLLPLITSLTGSLAVKLRAIKASLYVYAARF